jgi:hypothetical protein
MSGTVITTTRCAFLFSAWVVMAVAHFSAAQQGAQLRGIAGALVLSSHQECAHQIGRVIAAAIDQQQLVITVVACSGQVFQLLDHRQWDRVAGHRSQADTATPNGVVGARCRGGVESGGGGASALVACAQGRHTQAIAHHIGPYLERVARGVLHGELDAERAAVVQAVARHLDCVDSHLRTTATPTARQHSRRSQSHQR